jgi:hypothetical protein
MKSIENRSLLVPDRYFLLRPGKPGTRNITVFIHFGTMSGGKDGRSTIGYKAEG